MLRTVAILLLQNILIYFERYLKDIIMVVVN